MSYHNHDEEIGKRLRDQTEVDKKSAQSKEPQPVPEEIAELRAEEYRRNHLSNYNTRVQENGKKDFKIGYLIAASEISTLQKTIEEQKREVERLRELIRKTHKQNHLIYRRQNSSMTESEITEEANKLWVDFKSKHNL